MTDIDMTDIELIIKIPKWLYQKIKENSDSVVARRGSRRMDYILFNAVNDGVSLPSGHGDLIDKNRICKAIYAAEDNLTGSGMTYDEMDFYNDGINSMWDKLQNANPIISADKGE